MNKAAMHKNRKEDWETPPDIFEPLNKIFNFTIDLAANEKNHLLQEWVGPGPLMPDFLELTPNELRGHRGWINPPYGRNLPTFTEQIRHLGTFVPIAALLPASLDTDWFHSNVLGRAHIFCRRGRIQFLYKGKRPMRKNVEGKLVPNSNTGANILALYGLRQLIDLDALREAGWILLSSPKPKEGESHE